MKLSTRSEKGSALLIAVVVMALLSLLGLSYLFIADTENQIAMNQRDSEQLLFVAEAGAHMVKAWFNSPTTGLPSDPNTLGSLFLNTLDMRDSASYDRTQRVFDHDGDPNTADVTADGTVARPYHRQGMEVDPNATTYLSFYEKPYTGGVIPPFLGSEAGPDLILESNSLDPNAAGSVDLLDQVNAALFSDQPNTGRIERIDFYAPPFVEIGGVEQRYGFATVKITAAKYRTMARSGSTPITTPTSRRVAQRVVKIVLNESPLPVIGGPFNACKDNLAEALSRISR